MHIDTPIVIKMTNEEQQALAAARARLRTAPGSYRDTPQGKADIKLLNDYNRKLLGPDLGAIIF